MTKVLLMSDTHGYIDKVMLKHVEWADEVWHAGDIGHYNVTDTIAKLKPLKAVFGNIDDHKLRSQYNEDLVFYCEKIKVYITHIGGYPKKYHPRAKQIILNEKPNIFVCGHSHILKVINDKDHNLIHMNPGAIGIHGFHKVRTMLRFLIDNNKIQQLEVIEIDR